MLNAKAETYRTPGLFYCLVKMTDESEPEFFVVPANVIAKAVRKAHQAFLDRGGRDSAIRNFRDYEGVWLNRWDLLNR